MFDTIVYVHFSVNVVSDELIIKFFGKKYMRLLKLYANLLIYK